METNELNQEVKIAPSKPEKVSLAVNLLYASLGISVLAIFVQAAQAPASLSAFFVVIPLITLSIMGFLFYMIDKGKNWARITYLVLTILGAFSIFTTISNFSQAPLQNSIGIGNWVLQITALVLLFQTPSSMWFTEMKGK